MISSDDAASSLNHAAAGAAAPDASRHVPGLDGIRGLAVLVVLFAHVGPPALRSAGGFGVGLFFALSGYLITGILADGKRSPRHARTFYVRRALRIMPLYYGVLVLLLVVVPLVHRPRGNLYNDISRDQAWFWTYTSNWLWAFKRTHFDYVGHFWSLAVEEQFYLLWPLVVWRASRETALRVAIAAVFVAFLGRLACMAAGMTWLQMLFLTPNCLDFLGYGAIVALALRAPGDPRSIANTLRRQLWLAGLPIACLLVASAALARGGWSFGVTLVELMTWATAAWLFGLAVFYAATDSPRVLGSRPLRIAGLYSYGIYVLHPFVLAYAHSRWPQAVGSIRLAAGVVVASFAFAWLSYHVYEKHFLRLKDRLAPTRPAPGHVAARNTSGSTLGAVTPRVTPQRAV
jgi:peptidoglycan/LPS O-acetylase OafA/YrhL